MKILKSIILGLAGLTMFTSCSDWLDINDDPNTPTAAAAKVETLLPWCEHYVLYAYATQGYRSQFICQALTATSRTSRDGCSAQWVGSTSLSTTPYQFFFVGAGPNIMDMYKKAMSQEAWHYAGAAKLLKAYGFMLMADLYGEMPYTDALGENATPKYDNGETIYNGCLSDIEEAIELLNKTQDPAVVALSAGDSWNNGDITKWRKMAYLLKARLLNHLSKKSQLYNPDEILKALDLAQQSTTENTMIAHQDILETSSDILFGDPLYASPSFSNGGMGGGTTTRATQWLVDILTNFNSKGIEDPRADKILPWLENETGKWIRSKGVEMRTSNTIRLAKTVGPFAITRNATGNVLTDKKNPSVAAHSWYCNTDDAERWGDTIYVGFRSGAVGYFQTDNVLYNKYDDKRAESSSNLFLRPNSTTQWSTYAEACFIKAEVLFKKGDKSGAFTAYKEGVKSSLDACNEVLSVWSSNNALNVCKSFTQMSASDINNYLNNAIGDAGSITLEMIMTQKFIAMLYTQENWNDMRRMDYKEYQGWKTPFEFSVNGSNTILYSAGQQFRRIKQCSHELNYNSTNLEAIYPGYAKTNDIWSVPVWWDKAE